MNFSPFILTGAAGIAALLFCQVVIPTAKAQPLPRPGYRVTVEWQKADRNLSGLVIRGCLRNTGSQPLIYTKVSPLLLDGQGKTIYEGSGYLTVSPLRPGQSAEFRACASDAPLFRRLQLALREAGRPVIVETSRSN